MTEMQKLDKYLTEHSIKHTFKHGGYQIIVKDDNGHYLWDAICGHGSLGFETSLIEIMGCIVPECVSDLVEGYLTANEVIERIEKYYASNGLVLNNCKGVD